MHTYVTMCNTAEQQQKYRLETVSKRLLEVGRLKPFCTLYFYQLLIYDLVQIAEMAASDNFARIILLRNYK